MRAGAWTGRQWRWLAQGRSSDHGALLITNVGRIGHGFGQAVGLHGQMTVIIIGHRLAMLNGTDQLIS